jgi:hypothetical protein
LIKKISPAAVHALKEALTHVFWYKRDLRAFVTQVLQDATLINRVDWEGYKRNAVTALVDYMARHETKHQSDLLSLIEAVLQIEDFSHLSKLEDGAAKTAQAKAAVEALKRHAGRYAQLQEERRRAELERERRTRAAEQQRGVRETLSELIAEYYAICGQAPQPRGYSLERFLPRLFGCFDIDSKASFRLTGEQIDGAFTFDGTEWLFECKWQTALVGVEDLDAFGGKVQRRLENTLGLFLSINGFSTDGIAAYSKSRSVMILMDGADLMAVLEGRIAFDMLIRRKKAHASSKGDIFVHVQDIL